MAVWAYWKGARRHPGIDSGNTFLPTFEEGWWWFIPLKDEITSVGVVVDRASHESLQRAGTKEFYRSALERTSELCARLADATQVSELRTQRDWSYRYDIFHGNGFLAVGDAACFIDPLFSTGVHLAMLSGMLGAACVNTILDCPEYTTDSVLNFYQRQYAKEYERLKEQVYFLYSGHAASKADYFWHARNVFGQPGVKPERAFISLIAGSFEHRSWYHRFISRLRAPAHLENVVSGIFDGTTVGPDRLDLQSVLHRAPGWELQPDYALDPSGAHLRATQTIRTNKGFELPWTDLTEEIVALCDGRQSGRHVIESLTTRGRSEEEVRKTLSQVVSYGIVTAAQ
jgi:hypothetical protein